LAVTPVACGVEFSRRGRHRPCAATAPTPQVRGYARAAELEDRYETAVVEMLKQKQAGMPPRKEATVAPPSTVVNLMDAPRRSVLCPWSAGTLGKRITLFTDVCGPASVAPTLGATTAAHTPEAGCSAAFEAKAAPLETRS